MSGLYPNFEQPLPSSDNFNGNGLSDDLDKLDEVAASLNLTTLSEFVDARTMALEVLDEDKLPSNCPPVRWYSAQEGLATVQGLLLYTQKHPEQPSQLVNLVVADLERLAALLEEAKAQNTKFHLLIDL